MLRTDRRDAMYSEKLKYIIQELPLAIPTVEEIRNLTGLHETNATDYAKLNGVAVDPFSKRSSYVVVGENNAASYIDTYRSCNVLDAKRHKYCGVRPIIREDELSDDVKKTLQYMCQVNNCHKYIPLIELNPGMKNGIQNDIVDFLNPMKSKRYRYHKDRFGILYLELECIDLGTIPMGLATRSEEIEFMAAKDDYDINNGSSQLEKTSRVFSENLGLGKLEVIDPVYLFKNREFILTRTDRLPDNLNYAYVRSEDNEDNEEVLIEHSSDTTNRKISYKNRRMYSVEEKPIIESRNTDDWKQALLKVAPVTWVYDPRARVYICEQIIASARDISLDNFQLPKDFARQFSKHM